MIIPLVRMQQTDKFPTLLDKIIHNNSHENYFHTVDKLILSWQDYIHKNLTKLRKNMPTCNEE